MEVILWWKMCHALDGVKGIITMSAYTTPPHGGRKSTKWLWHYSLCELTAFQAGSASSLGSPIYTLIFRLMSTLLSVFLAFLLGCFLMRAGWSYCSWETHCASYWPVLSSSGNVPHGAWWLTAQTNKQTNRKMCFFTTSLWQWYLPGLMR